MRLKYSSAFCCSLLPLMRVYIDFQSSSIWTWYSFYLLWYSSIRWSRAVEFFSYSSIASSSIRILEVISSITVSFIPISFFSFEFYYYNCFISLFAFFLLELTSLFSFELTYPFNLLQDTLERDFSFLCSLMGDLKLWQEGDFSWLYLPVFNDDLHFWLPFRSYLSSNLLFFDLLLLFLSISVRMGFRAFYLLSDLFSLLYIDESSRLRYFLCFDLWMSFSTMRSTAQLFAHFLCP